MLRKIGKIAYIKSAIKEGVKPSPTRGIKIVKSANDGSVKNTEAIDKLSSFRNSLFLLNIPIVIEKIVAETTTVIV